MSVLYHPSTLPDSTHAIRAHSIFPPVPHFNRASRLFPLRASNEGLPRPRVGRAPFRFPLPYLCPFHYISTAAWVSLVYCPNSLSHPHARILQGIIPARIDRPPLTFVLSKESLVGGQRARNIPCSVLATSSLPPRHLIPLFFQTPINKICIGLTRLRRAGDR